MRGGAIEDMRTGKRIFEMVDEVINAIVEFDKDFECLLVVIAGLFKFPQFQSSIAQPIVDVGWGVAILSIQIVVTKSVGCLSIILKVSLSASHYHLPRAAAAKNRDNHSTIF